MAPIGSFRGTIVDRLGVPVVWVRVEPHDPQAADASPPRQRERVAYTNVAGNFDLPLPAGVDRIVVHMPDGTRQVVTVPAEAAAADERFTFRLR